MKKLALVWLLLLIAVNAAVASPLKLHLGEFTVTGVANKDEIKAALPALLSSRLSIDGISAVDSPAGADALILGSYTAFGAVFSIDATVKSASGETVGRSFVQGQGADDLIPAVGRLADQLRPVIKGITLQPVPQLQPKAAEPVSASPPKTAEIPTASVAAVVNASQVIAPKGDVLAMPSGDVIRTAPSTQAVARQERIEGVMLGIAPLRTAPGGEREIVLADARKIYLYRHGEGVKKVGEYQIKGEGQILALDTADADGDGNAEIYVTVMDREELKSMALSISGEVFTPIAERLPYYFRVINASGRDKQLVAQQIGKDKDDFYGDVRKVIKNSSLYTLGEPLKLPQSANIFSFNRFVAADGKLRSVMIDADGNLRVVDEKGEELWKGNERFGGSEVYFLRDEQQMQNFALDRYRWRFIEQRITVSPGGEIIVPRNSGFMVLGNSRSYSKNSVFGFAWNGASIEERWHTKESPNYLADYFYDAEKKELVILEQVQKSGIFSKGASAVSVRKVE